MRIIHFPRPMMHPPESPFVTKWTPAAVAKIIRPLAPPESPFVTTWTPTAVAKMMGAIITGGATTMAAYQAPSAFARWAPVVIAILAILALVSIIAWNIFVKASEPKKD
jgi:hypothetical protein